MAFKEVLYNDGEGLTLADLNDMQRFIRSHLNDGLLGMLAKKRDIDVAPDTSFLFAVANGGAPQVSPNDRQLRHPEGTLLFPLGGGVTGDDPDFLAYFVATNELQTTFGDNTSGQDRIDLVQVKIEQTSSDVADQETRDFEDAATRALSTTTPIKRRKTKITFSTKVGTPGTPPVEPAPDAGFLRWASVLIQDGIGANPLTAANIRDHRMPIGLGVYTVIPQNFGFVEGQYTRAFFSRIVSDGLGTRRAIGHLPRLGSSARLVRVGFGQKTQAASGATLQLTRARPTTDEFFDVLDLTSLMINDGTFRYFERDLLGATEAPIWANGHSAGFANDLAIGGTAPTQAGMNFRSDATDADEITLARFYVAGVL